MGISDPRVPQENGGSVRHWDLVRVYLRDVWRVHQRLTINYGLGWSVDRNLNYDLSKPAFRPGGLWQLRDWDMKAACWQALGVRGFLSGAVGKKIGLTVTSENQLAQLGSEHF